MTDPHEVQFELLDNADLDANIEVNVFLRRFHGTQAAVPPPAIVRELVQGLQGLPDPVTSVARAGGDVVGAATAWTPVMLIKPLLHLKDPVSARKVLTRWRLFSHMAVAPEQRGLGIGRQLVRLLEAECRRDGAVAMFGFAEDLPEPSWPFYERLGYRILGRGETTLIGGIPSGQGPGRAGRGFDRRLTVR